MKLKQYIGRGKRKKLRCMKVVEGVKKHQCRDPRTISSLYCLEHTIMSRRRRRTILRWLKNVCKPESQK